MSSLFVQIFGLENNNSKKTWDLKCGVKNTFKKMFVDIKYVAINLLTCFG